VEELIYQKRKEIPIIDIAQLEMERNCDEEIIVWI
jgi:hypothetical protein